MARATLLGRIRRILATATPIPPTSLPPLGIVILCRRAKPGLLAAAAGCSCCGACPRWRVASHRRVGQRGHSCVSLHALLELNVHETTTAKRLTGGASGWHCDSWGNDDASMMSWFAIGSSSSPAYHVLGFVIASSSCMAVKPELHVERWLGGNDALRKVGSIFSNLR